MAITKEKKKKIVVELGKSLKDSKSIVFVNFKGMTVANASSLRRSLRAEKIGFKVAKKTLIKRALDAEKIEGVMPEFLGELALAYGEDLLSPAREVYEFGKKVEGKLSIIGGIFEGKYMNKEEMINIASIPSTQVLRGMFVNIINSPIQRFVIALNQIALQK